jgi:hypothetical protein
LSQKKPPRASLHAELIPAKVTPHKERRSL